MTNKTTAADLFLATLKTDDVVTDKAGREWRLIVDADPTPGCAVWVVALDDADRDAHLVGSDIILPR